MKKMHMATVLIMLLVLTLSLTACGSEKAPETTAATVATTVPVETTEAEPLALADWNMSASTWSSPNGATIHITATPNYYAEGQKADFVVRLESDDVASIPCDWDGSAYTASVDLNAANGYCYYMVLTAADGTATEVAVNTPAAPVNKIFIDIEAALESYCSIIIEESTCEDNKLTLVSGNAQVQTPIITNKGEVITCQEAALVLSFNGEELDKKVLTLTQAQKDGLFEATLENIVFEIPDLEAEQKVELTMNAVLTNGQVLSAYGGNWLSNEEGLMPVVG